MMSFISLAVLKLGCCKLQLPASARPETVKRSSTPPWVRRVGIADGVKVNGPSRHACLTEICRMVFELHSRPYHRRSQPERTQGGVEVSYRLRPGDAGSCSLQQPSFNTARLTNDIIFRIPHPCLARD